MIPKCTFTLLDDDDDDDDDDEDDDDYDDYDDDANEFALCFRLIVI